MAALGYNVWLRRYIGSIIAALVAGLAGTLYAWHIGIVTPSRMGIITSAETLLAHDCRRISRDRHGSRGDALVRWLPRAGWAVQHTLASFIGRQVQVAGPVKIEWGSPTRIRAEDVRVANTRLGSQSDTAKKLIVVVYLKSLIQGPVHLPLIELEEADLLLERSLQGVGNWKFSTAAPRRRSQFPISIVLSSVTARSLGTMVRPEPTPVSAAMI